MKGTREHPGAPNGGQTWEHRCLARNRLRVSPSFNKLTSFIAKIDQNFNTNNNLTGRYFFGDSVQSFPLALTASGGQLPGFNTFTPTRVQLVSISYTRTFGRPRSMKFVTAGTGLRKDSFRRSGLPPQFDWLFAPQPPPQVAMVGSMIRVCPLLK